MKSPAGYSIFGKTQALFLCLVFSLSPQAGAQSKSAKSPLNRINQAFVITPDDPVINPLLIQYVAAFVPKAAGEHFNPHVTTGVASREYLDKMLAEPFVPFTFSPVGAAVYQLGQFGTAAKKLWNWAPQR